VSDYKFLENKENFVDREQRKKWEDDPTTVGRKNVLDLKDESFEPCDAMDTYIAKGKLAAESGKFVDGMPWDKFFHAKNMGEKIVGAYRLYLFTKKTVAPCEVINIGGEDYQLKDYGLDNCFSSGVDILIPWLCIQKKITKDDLRFQLAWEDRIHG
jgi:hypothetical protein